MTQRPEGPSWEHRIPKDGQGRLWTALQTTLCFHLLARLGAGGAIAVSREPWWSLGLASVFSQLLPSLDLVASPLGHPGVVQILPQELEEETGPGIDSSPSGTGSQGCCVSVGSGASSNAPTLRSHR